MSAFLKTWGCCWVLLGVAGCCWGQEPVFPAPQGQELTPPQSFPTAIFLIPHPHRRAAPEEKGTSPTWSKLSILGIQFLAHSGSTGDRGSEKGSLTQPSWNLSSLYHCPHRLEQHPHLHI